MRPAHRFTPSRHSIGTTVTETARSGNPFAGCGSCLCGTPATEEAPVAGLHGMPLSSMVFRTGISLPRVPSLPSLRSIHGQSDIGRVRRRNEDSFALEPELGVAVVADGMGGHPGGDVASRVAAAEASKVLAQAMLRDPSSEGFAERMRPIMRDAVQRAHHSIRERGTADPRLVGMGTTLTAIVVHPETGEWVIGHVGDSRAYRFQQNGFEQITRDDTWIQQQLEQNPELDPARARNSPYAHLLTQCVGLEEEPTPQILDGRAARADTFLLCSDGLVGMLEDHEIRSILSEHSTNGESAPIDTIGRLLAAANAAGGQDNITAALVAISDD